MRFSVMQWNIWTERPDNILQTIQSVNPDILCMQEVSQNAPHCRGINVARFLAMELGWKNVCFAAGDSPRKEWGIELHGNAILSFLPLCHAFQWPIKHPSDPANLYDKSPRVYVEVGIELAKCNLTVATVHTSFSDKFTNDEIKQEEMDRLMVGVERHKARYILTADLNALPGSYSYERITRRFKDYGPDAKRGTWPTKPVQFDGWRVQSLEYRMDFVFATPDVNVLKSEIIETSHSDHLPILCTFEV